MILLWLVVAMLGAVLVFEAGERWQMRQERRRQCRLDAYMQARTDERVREIVSQRSRHGVRGQGG